jgi:hypothetical protein
MSLCSRDAPRPWRHFAISLADLGASLSGLAGRNAMPDVMVSQHSPNLSPMSTAKPRERVGPKMMPDQRRVAWNAPS